MVFLVLLHLGGKRHRALERARAEHPSSRTQSTSSPDVSPDSASAADEESHLPPPTHTASKPFRTYESLIEVIEYAARAEGSDDCRIEAAGKAGDILGILCATTISAKKYRSGVVLDHSGDSVYLAVIAWDGRSVMPSPRTIERLHREFEDSGCAKMAVVTDAPRSFCEIPRGFEKDAPIVIPAEGTRPLLEGLNALEGR